VTEEFNQLYGDNSESYRSASPEARRFLWRVGPPVEKAGSISDHFDGQIAEKAIDLLAEIPQPFYLAVGCTKPHLPFSAPPAFWDLYDPEAFPLPSPRRRPNDVPRIGYHEGFELRDYHGVPQRGLIPDAGRNQLCRSSPRPRGARETFGTHLGGTWTRLEGIRRHLGLQRWVQLHPVEASGIRSTADA